MRNVTGRDGGTNWNLACGRAAKAAVLAGAIAGVLAVSACSNSSTSQRQAPAWQPARVDYSAPPLPVVQGQPPASPPTYTADGRVPMVAGVYKVGNPYVINGVTYVPAEDPRYDRVGVASWYGHDFNARRTANNEFYDMNRLTGAHPTLPLPTLVYVTNLRNGRTVIVRINDRGPYKPGRIIDVSKRAAQLLGFDMVGTAEVRVRYAGPAPLDPTDDRRERHYLAAQPWNRMASSTWGRWFGLGMGGGTP